MDNENNSYAPLLRLLGQMMKSAPQNPYPQNTAPSGNGDDAGQKYFRKDETGALWRRQENLELLAQFCREGYAMAKRHGHFLIGTGEKGTYLAVPGRFLLEEQPAGGVTGFTLWQPISGGEELYDTLESLSENNAKEVYGYWIVRLDPETLKISEV